MQNVNHVFKIECYAALSYLFIISIYISKQAFIQQPHKVLLEIYLVFIMINKLNADQALSEKLQHIDSAKHSQTVGSSHFRMGHYTLVDTKTLKCKCFSCALGSTMGSSCRVTPASYPQMLICSIFVSDFYNFSLWKSQENKKPLQENKGHKLYLHLC